MDRKKLSKILVYLILFIFLAHFIATKLYWYSALWWLDMLMHFLGGFWLGLISLYFFPVKDKSLNSVFRILLLVLFIGIGWEVFEIGVNDVIARNPFNFSDTASDVFFDLSGGLCAILYILVPLKNQRTGNKE